MTPTRLLLTAALLASLAAAAQADIDLELRPISATSDPIPGSVSVASTIRLGLFAVGDGTGPSLAAAQIVFSWDPAHVQLVGLDGTDGANLVTSAFPAAGSGGLNEANPPQDGDGFYLAFAQFGDPVIASDQGTLITSLVFEGVSPTTSTPIDILPAGGDPEVVSKVLDGTVPNLDVTGDLTGTSLRVAICVGDDDGDGDTDVFDYATLAGNFGKGPFPPFTNGDLDGDGLVDVFDFAILAPDFGCGTF